jgi:ribonuclease HI
MKGHISVDFLAEVEGMDDTKEPSLTDNPPWTLFTDGASSLEGSGAGLILTDPSKNEYTYALKFNFPTTNNEAEYEALLSGLRIARKMGVQNIKVFVDSQLVANHINGSFEANQSSMQQYLEETRKVISEFSKFTIEQVPRNRNKIADALSKLAASSFAHLKKELLVEVLTEKSIVPTKEVVAVTEEDCWMTPIKNFLQNSQLPEDRQLARKVRMKAPMYLLIDNYLFRKSFLGPHLRCVGPT